MMIVSQKIQRSSNVTLHVKYIFKSGKCPHVINQSIKNQEIKR